jgi:hypothetical protein
VPTHRPLRSLGSDGTWWEISNFHVGRTCSLLPIYDIVYR